jgi:tetratricopeptide (TPR) repeat protein
MEDYAGETALIEHLEAAMQEAGGLVTYNGRGFDLPLLESRWRMQRRRPRFPALHLDLLHYSRRLWRMVLPDCSLTTVESHVLGIHRISDVEGALVPRIYFDFLRGVRPERMVTVFDHHAQDIFTLAAQASAVIHAFKQPEDERFAAAEVQWGLARLYERLGRHLEAIRAMERAVLAARDEDFGYRLAMRLARAYRRRGRLDEAVAIWQARAPQCRPHRLEALVALAIHAEHTLKDFPVARRYAHQALAIVEQHAELDWLTGSDRPAADPRSIRALERQVEALRHRLSRLQRRIKTSSGEKR